MNNNRKQPHVSYSQISTYMLCPLKYRFSYIEELTPEFTPAALPFGGAIHESLAYFYRTLQNAGKKRPSIDDMKEIFRNDWMLRLKCEDVKFDKKDDSAESLMELGIKMLETFYENVTPGEVMCVEQEFCIRKTDPENGKLLPLPLVGFIDLIEKDKNGKIVVVDHKTAARKYPASKADNDLQLSIYSCVLSRSSLVNGDKLFNARFDVITKGKNPEFVTYPTKRTHDDQRKALKIVREVICAIDAGIFYPNVGWMCGSCQYQTACKSW